MCGCRELLSVSVLLSAAVAVDDHRQFTAFNTFEPFPHFSSISKSVPSLSHPTGQNHSISSIYSFNFKNHKKCDNYLCL